MNDTPLDIIFYALWLVAAASAVSLVNSILGTGVEMMPAGVSFVLLVASGVGIAAAERLRKRDIR